MIEQGTRVVAGEALIEFDAAAIATAGYDNTVMMIVTNTAAFTDVVADLVEENGSPVTITMPSNINATATIATV